MPQAETEHTTSNESRENIRQCFAAWERILSPRPDMGVKCLCSLWHSYKAALEGFVIEGNKGRSDDPEYCILKDLWVSLFSDLCRITAAQLRATEAANADEAELRAQLLMLANIEECGGLPGMARVVADLLADAEQCEAQRFKSQAAA